MVIPQKQQDLFLTMCFMLLSAFILSGCKTSRTMSSETSSFSRTVSGYPAREYYGDRWNTEHVRINSDPKPSGTVTLNLTPAGTSGFVMPVCGNVLSEFGPRSGRMHTGIDIKLKKEEPVYCAFDGMVRMAKNYGTYGNVVVVRHDNGLETLYAHLNSIAVKLNQRVKAGARIGGGGKTGNAQGEHLHFETRFKGEPFNPRLVVDFEKCRIRSETLALNDNSYKQYGKNLQIAETKPISVTESERKTVTTAGTTQPASKKVEHKVEKGDTLYSISRRYGTTVDMLRKLNNLSESSVIVIGQVLVVKSEE